MKLPLRLGLALVLAATAAAPLAAQQPPARERADRVGVRQDADRRPFDALLRHRVELQLTDDQVRRIEAIGQRLQAQNAPLRQRLVEQTREWRQERRTQVERMTPEQRREELRRLRQEGRGRTVPPDMQPLVQQMRVNINEAMHQAQSVLTAEQRVRAQQVLRRERTVRRPGARGERGERGPRGRIERRGRRAPAERTP